MRKSAYKTIKLQLETSVLVLFLCIAYISRGQHNRSHPCVELAEKAVICAQSGDRNAFNIAIDAFDALDSDATKADSAFVYFSKALALKVKGEREKAMAFFFDAQKLAIDPEEINLQYRILTEVGIMHRENRDFLQARQKLDSAEVYFVSVEDTRLELLVLIEQGHLWFDQGRNARALSYYIKARQRNENLKNIQMAAEINRSIGSTYLRLGSLFKYIRPEKAYMYFEEAYRYNLIAFNVFEEIDQAYGSCFCKVNLIEASLNLNRYFFADSIYKMAEPCLLMPDYHIILTLKMAQASMFENRGDLDMAASRLNDVLAFKYMMLAPKYYHEAYFRLARLARMQQLHDSAYSAASHASRWFAEKGLLLQAFEGYQIMADWFEEDGMIEKALQYNKDAVTLKNLLVAEADMETFDELRYKYETDLLQGRLHDAEESEQLQRQRLLVALIGVGIMFMLLMLSILLILARRKKALLLKQLAEEKTAKSIQESKARQLTLEQIKTAHELAMQKAEANKLLAEKKDQELLLNALRRAEIMNMQQEMKERLTPFLSKLNKKSDRDAFETLLSDFRHETTDDPMRQFETVFKQAYGGFYVKLVEASPDLTRSEIQLAVMLRLNLTSKEIAHILNLTTATVERTRHQLRNKLKLQPNQQLVAWLISLG